MSEQLNSTYRTIVVGFDGSDQARDALAFAGALSAGTGATVVAACVLELPAMRRPVEDGWLRLPRVHAEENAQSAAETGMVEPDNLETRVVEASSAARGLHSLAEDLDADLIVIGSAHHGHIGQALAGGVGHRLLHGAPCAVAVAPAGLASREPGGIGRIVVGFDGSRESMSALDGAIALSEATGARIRLAVVAQPPAPAYGKGGGMVGVAELEEAVAQFMEEQLTIGLAYAPGGLPMEGSVLHGDPAESLREAAADANVLMIGSRAYGPVRTVLLGSVSSKLTQSAPCTVVVYPRGVEGPQEQEAERERVGAEGR
jgi:nucleotide-binding universal stress UspA family protein